MKIVRFLEKPIITKSLDEKVGNSINGATLIRVPKWVKNPLGKYYLYFAHHHGQFIRLAVNDDLLKEWHFFQREIMSLKDTAFTGHVASPEIYINNDKKLIYMYYHGKDGKDQYTRVAVSKDGIHFEEEPDIIGSFYWRVFKKDTFFYAIEMKQGMIRRSKDGISHWESGHGLYGELDIRHIGLRRKNDDCLEIFYTKRGDCPESIFCVEMDISKEWSQWKLSKEHILVLEPETDYEGINMPLEPSKLGISQGICRQLRDPFVFKDDDKSEYLLYSAGGENSIAMAKFFAQDTNKSQEES